ncbi:MAG: SPOR domain-containing protein [Gammaproteobacteria bacterium HGW-Gammaproteobacteria-10]|nr:MAG: SPOR domain-containing protein [Gammaproteobacteria bacterium HGW-Gammaproteobacteria-10]
MLVLVIVVFPVLLLKWCGPTPENKSSTKQTLPKQVADQVKTSTKAKAPKPEAIDEPRFDFYTILPEKEVVVPDYEIKTRVREERVGKAKATQYLLQAGSFREFADADRLRARLALMGIESRVEKAQVGDVIWNRVKMGPYEQMSSVTTIKNRLKENGIDVMVTEVSH